MPVISFNGVDYVAPTMDVQNDSSATSFEALKVPTGQTIESVLNSNLVKAVRISKNIKTGSSATYRIGSAQVAVGSANFNTFDNYPTGKTIIGFIPMLAADSSSVHRGFLEVQTGNTGMYVFGAADITFGCHFLCLYRG